MKRPALILGLILALPASASAEWVRAEAEYKFLPIMSEEDACLRADERAKADAIRQVTGEVLSSEEFLQCTEQGDEVECTRNSTIWTSVGGEILSFRNRQSQTSTVIDDIRKCLVSFEADVHVAEGKPDPNFDVDVKLNNPTYRDGENLVVTLNPSQPMSVQIFQWLPYEKGDIQVGRIFPNQFDSADRIIKPVTIPTEAGAKRYDLKVSFPTGRPANRKWVDEYLMVVATKKPMALSDSYTLEEFKRKITEIPLGDRRIVRRLYKIVRGAE
jgi:hypothetical protein